jgi:3-oxoacyl-[acyl-carrier protein] reductase
MQIRFDGKTVVVSGAGHGFGRCIAETFAQLGARVFGCDLSTGNLRKPQELESTPRCWT